MLGNIFRNCLLLTQLRQTSRRRRRRCRMLKKESIQANFFKQERSRILLLARQVVFLLTRSAIPPGSVNEYQ